MESATIFPLRGPLCAGEACLIIAVKGYDVATCTSVKQKARKTPIFNHVYVMVNHINWCNHKGLRILISNHGAQRPDKEFGIHHRPLFELAALTGFLTLLDQSVHKVKVGTGPPAEL